MWKFFVLRNLTVTHADQALDPITGRGKRELLAWLVLHPGIHDRTTVAGQIWMEDSDSVARRKLRQALKALLDALGPDFSELVSRSQAQVGIPKTSSVWVDVHALEELAEEGGLDAILDITEAELMPELSTEWITPHRVAHAQAVIAMLERLANRAELRGEMGVARTLTSRWVDLSPSAETPRREMVRRLIEMEDVAGASVAAEELLSTLRERGLKPSPETLAVLAELHREPSSVQEDPSKGRDALLVRLGSSDQKVAVQAAHALAVESLRRDEHGTCLPLTVETDPDAPALRIRAGIASLREVKESLATVRDLLPEPDRFLAHVLQRLFEVPDLAPTAARDVISRVKNVSPRLVSIEGGTVLTERVATVIERLRAGDDIAMIGPSASGKTVAAAQIVHRLAASGWTASWIDLSEPTAGSADLFISLALCEKGPAASHLIVLDDIQANPGLAIQIGNLLSSLSGSVDSSVRILLLGWDSARALAGEACPGAVTVACSGEDLLRPVIEGLIGGDVRDEVLSELRHVSAGDLLVANKALEHYLRTGEVPSLEEIAGASFVALTGDRPLSAEATRLAFCLAALGQFEIDAARNFAEAQSRPALEELVERRIVRPSGSFVAIGHRSHAALIAMHLQREWPELVAPLGSPVKLSLEYLRTAGDEQIVAMLQRLDLASAARKDSDQHGSTFLARAWESIQVLRNYLRRQAEGDATWGDNIASAIHASQTFSRFDEEAWRTTAQFVRRRWAIDADELPRPRGETSRERDDFTAIAEKMRLEDVAKKAEKAPVELPADSIDFDRMHRTWVLGQLLGFEGSAPSRCGSRVEDLVKAAERAQEPEGNFYPARVPWVTARVVLGLTAVGHTISSSRTVQQASQWLRRPYPEGPYRAGAWESGTGTWNSTVETTAMCLAALIRAGISLDDLTIRAGRAYLLSQRAAWIQPGAEVDAADSLEAYILTGGRWREVSAELMHLLSWARDREPWTRTSYLASESQAQSSAVALVANSLVGILWATVKAELPILLEGIATERDAPIEPEHLVTSGERDR